ncbi:glutamate ABC transporter permease [Brenneria roseae subsp. roseae]|uniref:amino acid ABC transporter permease n=1 Tax=Brenneria roseae TaxID=1509241 RepID=UPI000D616D93|nr:amino acid ABC transporter permease [Brenneria roseae]PWC22754.1 glutamate ABC transporter permease [Brenneria roseae subsp. roseae]
MDILFQTAPDGELYISWLLSGLCWTLALAIFSAMLAFCIGVLVGICRSADSLILNIIGRIYVQVFRNIPLIVQMFLVYFVLPDMLPPSLGDPIKQLGAPWGSFIPALICLSLYTGARIAEQVKAGLLSLPRGQKEASEAIGLNTVQKYMLILLPQALRIIVPTLTSEAMGVFKNTSVALAIGLLELTAQAQQISEFTYETFEAFFAATVCYGVLALIIWTVMTYVERRIYVPGFSYDRPGKGAGLFSKRGNKNAA